MAQNTPATTTPGSSTKPKQVPANLSNKEKFIIAHWEDAKSYASTLGIPPSYILAVSGNESGWGTADISKRNNSYFGMHTSKKNPTLNEIGQDQAKGDPNILLPKYKNYYDSMVAWGNFVTVTRKQKISGTTPQQFGAILHSIKFGTGEYENRMPEMIKGGPKTNGKGRYAGIEDIIKAFDLK